MTSASDTTATADRGPRERLLRDLYAIAAFYVAHPDYPLPTSVQIHHHASLSEVERVASEYSNGHVYGDVPQTHHELADVVTPVTFIVAEPNRTERPL